MRHKTNSSLFEKKNESKDRTKMIQCQRRWRKRGGRNSPKVFFSVFIHMPASILFLVCETFLQSIWAHLQETCMRLHVCPMCLQKSPTCHQYNPISQQKSPLFNQKRQAWRIICVLYVFKRAVYRMKRGLQCIGVTRIDLCNMSRWNHVCCSVLQCVLQYVLIHVRRLPGTTCVVLCCSVCCSLCWFMRDVTWRLHICDPTTSSV